MDKEDGTDFLDNNDDSFIPFEDVVDEADDIEIDDAIAVDTGAQVNAAPWVEDFFNPQRLCPVQVSKQDVKANFNIYLSLELLNSAFEHLLLALLSSSICYYSYIPIVSVTIL